MADEQKYQMTAAEKEIAQHTLTAAQALASKGDLREYARLLDEAAALARAAVAQRG